MAKFTVFTLLALLCGSYVQADLWERQAVCREQRAQDFLIRESMRRAPEGFEKAIGAAIRYRVERYGWVTAARQYKNLNPLAVTSQTEPAYFMGLPVTLHKKIVSAVKCVETAILAECSETYVPARLSGLRERNSYRGGEISNHMFGLALDIDPERNPCCGCVEPWSNAPKCRKPAKSPLDRAELPRCWIDTFERYGFYWLGWDHMEDTMHFEFLGDPDRILR